MGTAAPRSQATETAIAIAGFAAAAAYDWPKGLGAVPTPWGSVAPMVITSELVAVGVLIAGAFLWRLFEPRTAGKLDTLLPLLLGTLSLVSGIAAIWWAPWASIDAVQFPGKVLSEATAAAVLLLWFRAIALSGLRPAPVMAGGLAVATLCLIGIRMGGNPAVSLVDAGLPCLSASLLLLLQRRQHARPSVGPAESGAEEPTQQSWSSPLIPTILMAAYTFIFTFFTQAPSAAGAPIATLLGMAVIALGTWGIAQLLGGRFQTDLLYKVGLPIAAAGLVLIACLPQESAASSLLTGSGEFAFRLFMLIALMAACQRFNLSAMRIFGAVGASSRLASLAAIPLGQLFFIAYPLAGQLERVVAAAVCVFILSLSTMLFGDRFKGETFGMAPVQPKGSAQKLSPASVMTYNERIVWECTIAARHYGLTQREQDVLEMLVQGHTIPAIAEKASISHSTAKTHLEHIYRKMNVHSRDEATAATRQTAGLGIA